MKPKSELFATGEDIQPESEINKKSVFHFFSEFLSLKIVDITELLVFTQKWGIITTFSEDTKKNIINLQKHYRQLLLKIINNEISQITKAELDSVNKLLTNITPALHTPLQEQPLNQLTYIQCFYDDNEKLSMDVEIKSEGHPDIDEEAARIVCNLMPRQTNTFNMKKTPVDKNLFKYLQMYSKSQLNDGKVNDWIVEKQKFVLKEPLGESYNQVTFYIEGINKRPTKQKIETINASYSFARNLDTVLAYQIWWYFNLGQNQQFQKTCKICYSPVSRANSKHCGKKECIDRLKSVTNHKYYNSHK